MLRSLIHLALSFFFGLASYLTYNSTSYHASNLPSKVATTVPLPTRAYTQGVFVLQSHSFPPLEPLSSYRGAAADLDAARHHLVFPQALIQGALARLGMHTTVTCESSQLPQCKARINAFELTEGTFQIRTVKNTPSRKDSAGAASILSPMSPR